MNKLLSCLNKTINCTIVKIKGLVYFHNGMRSSIQELQIIFENKEKMILSSASDGESILIKDTELKEIDMDVFGKFIIEDLSDDIFFNKFLNISLNCCNFIYSNRDSINVGVCFSFINNTFLYILNLGDELFFYDKLPREIELEEELILVE